MKMKRIGWHAISQISRWLWNIRDEKWRREEDRSADLLKDIETDEERERNSLGVPHHRLSALNKREEAAIRLIVSHSVRFSAVPDRKTIREQEGNRRQHSTWVSKVEMKYRDKKKVQLQDVDCKGFCCYSAKGKRYGGASIESPKQVGMFRVSPPH